jgi:hypothetical protein
MKDRQSKGISPLQTRPNAKERGFIAMDISRPKVDFQSLARSMGVEPIFVNSHREISEAVETAINSEIRLSNSGYLGGGELFNGSRTPGPQNDRPPIRSAQFIRSQPRNRSAKKRRNVSKRRKLSIAIF